MTRQEWVQKRYTQLRRRFFTRRTITAPGFHVPPTAGKLTWVWVGEYTSYFGATLFDEDNHPYELHMNEILLRPGMDWELDRVLAHEMTHMRLGPGYDCFVHGPKDKTRDKVPPTWLNEQRRLAALGFRFL